MVLPVRPLIGVLKATADDPDPSAVPPEAGALVPKVSLQVPGFVVLYLNQPVAEAPLGSPVPLRVALDEVIFVAGEIVVIVGGSGVV